ncbi:hypothetical protein [Lysinibacillus boronitolerans]|uniref:hypothetical protein n=1 Tax=Lysinibacillus boronitolerans TaxID=309788 RepID=UPI0028989709|nr:hypothetical protein [Lysinibacillus boronitolerans]
MTVKTLKVVDKIPEVKDNNLEEYKIFKLKDTTLKVADRIFKVTDKNPKVEDSN